MSFCATACLSKKDEGNPQISISSSKEKANALSSQLEVADTIFIVTHEQTYGPILNKKTNKYEEAERLVINNTINQKVIQETKLIEGEDKKLLIDILTEEIKGSPISLATCFEPQHAILLVKNKNISYLEICFTCGGVATGDLNISSADFDDQKWDKLYKFINSRVQLHVF